MATIIGNMKKLTWAELGEALSKAGVLMADEDIDQVTLIKPCSVLLHTSRPAKKSEEE